MTEAPHDDPAIFRRYRQMRLQRSGLNEDLKQPALRGELHWSINNYADESPRIQGWVGTQVTKHHRRITTLISAVLAAGLALSGIDEPYTGGSTIARRPDLAAAHLRRPPLLILAAREP